MGAKTSKILKYSNSEQKIFENAENKEPHSPDMIGTPFNEPSMCNKAKDIEECFRDPRSPTTSITRTPIVFESDQSKSFVFEEDDTFNELFSANPDPKYKKMEKTVNQIDPRSPSLDIDRTPLDFDDLNILDLPPITLSDDDENADELIQGVLDMLKDNDTEKPKNKQIEKVKNLHKKINKKVIKSSITPNIYQDSNVFYSTPKKDSLITKDVSQVKRTPLGCVANKMRVRSRSVENFKYKTGKSASLNFDENSPKNIKRVTVFEIDSENNSFII